jgi:DNA-binding transcriptional MerR regulator
MYFLLAFGNQNKMAEYKIKDLETLTGIKAHTIRIWEKRYGLISPERTETLIRTYSDEELTMLLNIAMLNKHGLKISKIAKMNPEQISSKVWDLMGEPSVDSCTEKFILALLDLNEALFKDTLQFLIDEKGLEATFRENLIPFLDRIGVMWLVGTINTAQEHFISNLIRQKIISAIDKLEVPTAKENPVMLFLPEHEWHEISLLFYHYSIRRSGLYTMYLGQSLPYDALLECIERFKPKAIVTSWLTAVDNNYMKNFFKQLYKDANELPIYAGGYQINSNRELIAEFICEISSIEEMVQTLNK